MQQQQNHALILMQMYAQATHVVPGKCLIEVWCLSWFDGYYRCGNLYSKTGWCSIIPSLSQINRFG
jgi:hypothetical protein